jgi:hypothetical protein
MYIEKAAETKFFSYGIFLFRILPKTFLYREKKLFFPSQKTLLDTKKRVRIMLMKLTPGQQATRREKATRWAMHKQVFPPPLFCGRKTRLFECHGLSIFLAELVVFGTEKVEIFFLL